MSLEIEESRSKVEGEVEDRDMLVSQLAARALLELYDDYQDEALKKG